MYVYIRVYIVCECVYLIHLTQNQETSPLFVNNDKTSGTINTPEVDSDSNRNEYQEHFLGVEEAGA